MARNSIAEKLATLLADPTWDEPRTLYLFAQMRKLLDHRRESGENSLPILRFYCDWAVHISKDRIDPTTLKVLKELEEGAVKQIKSQQNLEASRKPIDFAYFEHLKPEVIFLLQDEGIPTAQLSNQEKWTELISQLVKILEEQPMLVNGASGLNISVITFQPSKPRCVIVKIDFIKPVKDTAGKAMHYFSLANVY